MCEQICRNTVGSYTCSCNAGYALANDRLGCTSKTIMQYLALVLSSLAIQILMNVLWALMRVLKPVSTLLALTAVVVTLAIAWTLMAALAMVTYYTV